jgi:hypothetical protein
MRKPNLMALLVLLATLLLGAMSELHAQGRSITPEEMLRLGEVDENYLNNVTSDANGNYVDNNTLEAKNLATLKADARDKKRIIDPAALQAKATLNAAEALTLPALTVTGDENYDISTYKEVIKSWVALHPDYASKIDATMANYIAQGNYQTLYKLQLKNTK